MCWQLRNQAEKRQVPNAKIGLQHNIGLGGAAVVALYRHGFPHLVGPQKINVNTVSASGNDAKPEDFDAHLYFKELEDILKEVSQRTFV